MKRITILVLLLTIGLTGCNGQQINKENKETNQPQTYTKVNKEYDENGNLIRYDSTYSYFFSSQGTDSLWRDSVFDIFRKEFNQNYFFSENPFFRESFFVDSLLSYDFYTPDFFMNRFRNNHNKMMELFREMDSLKNEFYRQQMISEEKKGNVF